MPAFTQDGHFMAITTPLGKDKLLLDTFAGTEAMSQLFQFKLGMFAESDTQVKFEDLLGQKVTVTFPGTPPRHFNGIISRLTQGQRVQGLNEAARLIRFEAELVPKLWLLTKNFQSRIFQQKTVPEILEDVFKDLDISMEVQVTYEPRDYCVQYRESDFDFASRLMEEEGIYYYFKHTEDAHKMVIADKPQSHVAVAGSETINYEEVHGAARQDERISSWTKTQELRTAKQTLRDHSFELPDDNLEAVEPITETLQVGTVTHKLKVGPNTELENYDFPGRYAQRFDGIDPGGGEQAGKLQKIFEDNMRTARIRIEEEAGPGLVIAGQSDCRVLMPGHKFTLGGHFDANGSYVLTEVKHTANIEGTYAQSPTEFKEAVYANNFKCIPFAVPFRPLRRTRKARVRGTQTAVVVGPSGEEIFTDKYGRVKVQFYWDRKGEKNADSSCWIRVASQWAGKQWGGINIPRIGQEVVVVFEEGDPDQPIIVGNVYNAEQMPPYSLPDNKTQSGFKSRSSPGGSAENFNELRFEDKKDAEEIYFHARKDFTRMVQTGNDKLTVEEGNREATISKGDDTTKVSAGKSTLEAATSIELKVGSNTIKIDTTGITINGAMVKVEGSSLTEIKGAMVKIN